MAVISVHGKQGQVVARSSPAGKTQAMLELAAAALVLGRVFVVGIDALHATELRDRLRHLKAEGATVITLGHHRRLRGVAAMVFIDHEVLVLREERSADVIAMCEARVAAEMGMVWQSKPDVGVRATMQSPAARTAMAMAMAMAIAVLAGFVVGLVVAL